MFVVCGEDEGYELDDVLFDDAIDMDAEWCCICNEDKEGSYTKFEETSNDDVESSEDEDFNSDLGDENNTYELNNAFKSSSMFNPEFIIGQKFSCKKLFKGVVRSHGIKEKRDAKITKNDKRRIYARCVNCDWFINALKVEGKEPYQIRKINDCHTCSISFHVKQMNSTWISKRYVGDFRSDPKKDVDGFRNFVARETKLNVSRHQAYRVKVKARKLIEGSNEEQYNLIWDYARALKDRNPGSTVKICVYQGADGRNSSVSYMCVSKH
ncbi:hypothetical protein ACS0TY_029241 [Phlomoides rotata]